MGGKNPCSRGLRKIERISSGGETDKKKRKRKRHDRHDSRPKFKGFSRAGEGNVELEKKRGLLTRV
jgi:hypothetical protein